MKAGVITVMLAGLATRGAIFIIAIPLDEAETDQPVLSCSAKSLKSCWQRQK
jgi:hypothetical protein